jgi:Pyruvate/2-oxoacid:ferredoxin oxidoreductase delta subunit
MQHENTTIELKINLFRNGRITTQQNRSLRRKINNNRRTKYKEIPKICWKLCPPRNTLAQKKDEKMLNIPPILLNTVYCPWMFYKDHNLQFSITKP